MLQLHLSVSRHHIHAIPYQGYQSHPHPMPGVAGAWLATRASWPSMGVRLVHDWRYVWRSNNWTYGNQFFHVSLEEPGPVCHWKKSKTTSRQTRPCRVARCCASWSDFIYILDHPDVFFASDHWQVDGSILLLVHATGLQAESLTVTYPSSELSGYPKLEGISSQDFQSKHIFAPMWRIIHSTSPFQQPGHSNTPECQFWLLFANFPDAPRNYTEDWRLLKIDVARDQTVREYFFSWLLHLPRHHSARLSHEYCNLPGCGHWDPLQELVQRAEELYEWQENRGLPPPWQAASCY